MVSSAVHRYFPSRDDLLTALIVDAFDAVGEAADRTLESQPNNAVLRWRAVARAIKQWALAHPRYALIYGSPVPATAPRPKPRRRAPASSRSDRRVRSRLDDAELHRPRFARRLLGTSHRALAGAGPQSSTTEAPMPGPRAHRSPWPGLSRSSVGSRNNRRGPLPRPCPVPVA